MKKQEIIQFWISLDILKEDIFLMLQKALNISSKELFFLDTIPQEDILKIKKMFHLKNTGIPIEQILWETDFYGYIFFLNEHTLIPKNDTEVLVEKAIEYIKWQNKKMSLVDVWTGTGCIPMAILKQLPGEILESYGIDISPQALAIAKKNSAFHWLLEKLILIEWDLFAPLQDKVFKNLVVTANLPYILDGDFDNMDYEVVNNEPHTALFGWPETGFELYEKLIAQLQSVKAETIILFIEIWFDQSCIMRDYSKRNNIEFHVYKDNAWVERCVEMKIR